MIQYLVIKDTYLQLLIPIIISLMSYHQIQYSANYGRHRNLMGNWLHEELSNEPSPDFRSRKKQYPKKKCQIEMHSMLNMGKSFLPTVADLILDISDIQGTHTDTIKSDAVRNRLIAKHMRESRERRLKTQQPKNLIQTRQAAALASLPKKSYHLAPISPDSNFTKLQNQQKTQRSVNHQRTCTQSNQPNHKQNNLAKNLQISRTSNLYLNPEEPKQKQMPVQLQKLNKAATLQVIKPYGEVCSAGQDGNSYDKKYIMQRKSQHMIPSNNFISENQRKRNPSLHIHRNRLARINPTFLSYGSQYLYNGNNYLASYGKGRILY